MRGRIRQRIFFIARSATEPTEVTLVMELALEWDVDVRLIRLSGARPEIWVRARQGHVLRPLRQHSSFRSSQRDQQNTAYPDGKQHRNALRAKW